MRVVLLEIRVAHAPGAAGYLDLLWLRNSGRDAASANNEPRAPTHARIGKPRKHKQGLKGRAGGVCMSNMVSRKKPSVRAPIRGQSGRAGGQAPALQAAIETCAAADAAVPGALRAASLRRLAAQDARTPRWRGHICWRTRLWRSRHPRTRERGDRGGTGRLRGGAGQLGGCKRVLLWCIQPPVAPRARPINMTGTPVPLYCAPRRHALHRGARSSLSSAVLAAGARRTLRCPSSAAAAAPCHQGPVQAACRATRRAPRPRITWCPTPSAAPPLRRPCAAAPRLRPSVARCYLRIGAASAPIAQWHHFQRCPSPHGHLAACCQTASGTSLQAALHQGTCLRRQR